MLAYAAAATFPQYKLTARDVTLSLFKAGVGARPNFSDRDLSRLDIAMLDFSNVNLARSNLFGADLTKANFENANLSGARLDRSTITSAIFKRANLQGASILRPNIFTTLSSNPKELATFEHANLADAHITGNLSRVSFRNANLTNAIFGAKDPRSEELITARVELQGCDFTAATLVRAVLSNNEASYAKFTNANLSGAKLINVNLTLADFQGANLAGTDFTGAQLDDANFKGAKNIENAIGLP